MSRFALPIFVAAVVMVSACGERIPPGVPPGPATVVACESSGLPGELPSEELGPIETVTRIEPPVGILPWVVRGATSVEMREVATPDGGERKFLLVSGAAEVSIAIPGPHDPTRFDQVVCELFWEGAAGLGVRLLSKGAVVHEAEGRFLSPNRRLERPSFDFPRNRSFGLPFDEMELVFASRGATLGVAAVELRHRPLGRWIADPADEPVLIAVGSEARRGFILTTERPLEAWVDVEPGSYDFSFSYAWPASVRDGERPVIQVMRWSGVPEALHEYDLSDTTGWIQSELGDPVEVSEPTRLRYRIALVEAGNARRLLAGEEPKRAACAIADPGFRLHEPLPELRTVLLVTSDTHRGDYLGAARSGVDVRTPALDALAAEGVLFEDCWSSTNITNPSHIALMTGTSPRDTRVVTNTVPLADAARTLAEEFQRAGFVTWAVLSVTNLGHVGSGLGQGFDRVATPEVPPVGDAADAVARVLTWLPDAEGRPLFLWVHLFDAHSPYGPPPSHDRLYYPRSRDPFDPVLGEPIVPDEVLPLFLRGLRDLAYPEAQYRAEVTYLDSELGRLFAAPRFAKAVIAVTGDHGESLGEHTTYYDHVTLYPDTLHVPLVLRAPSSPRGRRVTQSVRQIDLGRTLLDLAGLAAVEFPGENLLAELDGPKSGTPRFALAAQGNAASIQRDHSYLILHLVDHREHQSLLSFQRHQVELYDLAVDPGCGRDLVEGEHTRARALRAELVHWLESFAEDGLAGDSTVDSERLRELAGLGYLSHGSSLSSGGWFTRDDCAWCTRYDE